jgi:hypothetical protein
MKNIYENTSVNPECNDLSSRRLQKHLLLIGLIILIPFYSFSQGCVAIRSNGVCTMDHPTGDSSARSWQLNTGYRYFKSFRHFRGTEEQKERLIAETEVINWQNTLDLSLVRVFNQRWSMSIGLPIVYNDRSSLYEHGRTERHVSSASSIGDIRLLANRWMVDPAKGRKGNFQLGLGLKLPTGAYKASDEFYNVGPGGTEQVRPVDQSIQPGDGGLGMITELNGFLNFSHQLGSYANLFYLINPRETNGTRTFRETLSPTLANEAIMSVTDQYMIRLGLNYDFAGKLQDISASAGGRMEGIPVYDLIGGSQGFRRPGYVISVEPGLRYGHQKLNFFASAPIALSRNRTQSVTDKENSIIQNKFINGDAAFADYSLNIGIAYRF